MMRTGLFAVVLAIAVSCTVKEAEPELVQAPMIFGHTEGEHATKTAITVDGEGVGTILWKPADNINVFFGTTNVRYYSTNEVDATTVVFETSALIGSTESASDNKWGLYPYDASASSDGSAVTTTIPAVQQCVPETFGNNLFPMIAHTSTNELHFKNVCGGIKFSLSRDDIQSITFRGNNNEDIVGQVQLTFNGEDDPVASVVAGEKTITLTPSAGATFESGTNYYLVMLPKVLSGGFTMTFETETEIGTFEYTAKTVEIKRSIFARKADIDTYASFVPKTSPAVNLSQSETANCYIVTEAGNYKFQTVQGNSSTSVGTVASVEVLWESFGTNETPSVGDLVNTVSVDGDYIVFSASNKKGNAVIAAKDGSNNILWSWHIWLTAQPSDQVYNNNAGIVMDRNLGATSATPGEVAALGLLYQWGRKDPFLGSSLIWTRMKAMSTITWPEKVTSDSYTGTIEYANSHPTTYIAYNSNNHDWYYSEDSSTDNTRWQMSDKVKGVYDPCPVGYRVPDGGDEGIWAKAFGTSSKWETSSNWDATNKGMDFGATDKKLGSGSIWYPAAGSLGRDDGTLIGIGVGGIYWSCSQDVAYSFYASGLHFANLGDITPSPGGLMRAHGHSVRCVKDN